MEEGGARLPLPAQVVYYSSMSLLKPGDLEKEEEKISKEQREPGLLLDLLCQDKNMDFFALSHSLL